MEGESAREVDITDQMIATGLYTSPVSGKGQLTSFPSKTHTAVALLTSVERLAQNLRC